MDRKQYNTCMVPYMKGSKTKEERQQAMCVGAKLCTGKATSREEAERICSLPRPAKPPKVKRDRDDSPESCEKSAVELVRCMGERINMDAASNVNSIEMAMFDAMMECKCQNK